jgi:outer membrane protein TolC
MPPRTTIGSRTAWLARVATLLALVPAAWSEPMPEVVRIALQDHPRIRAALAGTEASGFALDQARSARMPQLALVADPGRSFVGSKSAGTGQDVGDIGLRGSVLVYDGGRTSDTIAREQDRVRVAQASLRLASEDLAARVVELYLEWYLQDQLAQIAADNVEAHQALYDRVRDIASFDRGRASDLLQVGARLEQARLALAVRRGAADEARSVLTQLAGRELTGVEAPRDPVTTLPATLGGALALVDGHPVVAIADAEAQVAQRASQLAAAWARPRLDLLATVESPVDLTGERRYFDEYSVRLAATWAPVDGGAGRSGARVAERQMVQAQEVAQGVRRELAARVAGLWAQLVARRERVQGNRALLEQTTQVREAYWQQFTIGRRSIIDLLNAQTESFQARLAAEDERVQLLQAEHRLLASVATLTSWLGVASRSVEAP